MRLGLEGGGARHVNARGRQVQVDGRHHEALSRADWACVAPRKGAVCTPDGTAMAPADPLPGASGLRWEQGSL